MSLSPELTALRDEAMQTSCEAWAKSQGWKLSAGIDRSGPCPNCGGKDRFSIHTTKNTFFCRSCEIRGSGVIKLVMLTQDVEFTRACEIITGRTAAAPIDPVTAARIAEENAEAERKRLATEARKREEARRAGHEIWTAGWTPDWLGGSAVVDYLARRGIALGMGDHHFVHGCRLVLREAAALPYVVEFGGKWHTLHTGPAMLAAVQRPDGTFGAVHQTWIDLDLPKGKLVLPSEESGKARPSKKVRGTKKGGAIRLYTPARPRRIVMGEGIETTLTALVHNYQIDTAYWAGVDLGNMSGKAARGADGKWLHDQPDMADLECFLPPDWCAELVYLCDGDDPQSRMMEKILRGLRRAKRVRDLARRERPELPVLAISYVPPAEPGKDLNDLVQAGGDDE